MFTKMKVNRGLRLLQKEAPDKLHRINLGQLSMEDADYCVLGQMFGSYLTGLSQLDLGREGAKAFGFYTQSPQDWNKLNRVWKNKLAKLKQKQAA